MRRIGTINDPQQARQILGYFRSESIDAYLDPLESTTSDSKSSDSDDSSRNVARAKSGGKSPKTVADPTGWDIWIRDEEQVSEARDAWNAFQESPSDQRFDVELAELPKPATSDSAGLASNEQAGRNRSRMTSARGQANRRSVNLGDSLDDVARQQRVPIVLGIIALSVICSLATNFGKPRGLRNGSELSLEQRVYKSLSFVDEDLYEIESGDSFASLKRGQGWRVITPMFLHGDEFHLAFNMLWIFFLGSVIERLHGSLFMLGLTIFSQLGAMALQVGLPDAAWVPEPLVSSPFVIGASGVVYGLFGFLWIRPIVNPSYPAQLVPLNIVIMIAWLFACMTPLVPNVANGAHLGGLLAGMFCGSLGYFSRG